MKPYQAIGYMILNTSAITAITSTRVYHGLRPVGTVVPCINYYELGGGQRGKGMESVQYSINCRATTAAASRNLARLVLDLFTASNGMGIDSIVNSSFQISRASFSNDGGLIPETEDGIFNSPVDIRVVYPISTIS
jgi:hypothetical protein